MSETVWTVRPADPYLVWALAARMRLPKAIATMLVQRGYDDYTKAVPFYRARNSLDWLNDFNLTPSLEKAVKRIKRAIDTNEPFVIYGDYDCDGVTSTTILYRYLARGLKANCTAYLPDRFKDGYGVTAAAVARIAASGVKLILTCDNGISAIPAAEKAKELGVEIVVTDHHQPPEVLPEVHSIVHPAHDFPPGLTDLAGVGVALCFITALEGGFTERLAYFLEVAAIGTIGDVVPLNGPNRPLVWAGMERFRTGKRRWPGLDALVEVAKTDVTGIRAEDIGFQLCPRLNAAGRLETPDVGFRLLATNDKAEAATYAAHLDAINAQRRELSADLQAAVFSRIDADWNLDDEPFIVLADDQFHHGITGIIAGRVKDRYRAPVLLFSGHGEGAWKASGRSPDGVHLYEALHAARGHLLGFGGHAGAAGCSAEANQLPAIRKALNAHVKAIGWRIPPDTVTLDAELPFAEANADLLAALDQFEPYGQRNPAPVFGLMRARVVAVRTVKNHLFMTLDDGESTAEVIAWGKADLAPSLDGYVRLTYRPQYNTFRGETKIQLVATRLEPAPPPPPVSLQALRRATPLLVTDGREQTPEPEPTDGVYARLAPEALKGRWVGPLTPVSQRRYARLWLLDVPRSETALLKLAEMAEELILAWPTEAETEQALTTAWLPVFWSALHQQDPDMKLADALAATGFGTDWRIYAALDVFREAGILVERDGFWQLLDYPQVAIAINGFESHRAEKEAKRFRERVRTLSFAEIEKLTHAMVVPDRSEDLLLHHNMPSV